MSVIVTVRVSGDSAAFEEQVAAQAEAIGRIMDGATRHGLIAHRWYGADGEFMAIDEWPDAESFQAFFDEAQPDIGPGHAGDRCYVTAGGDRLADARDERRSRLERLSPTLGLRPLGL